MTKVELVIRAQRVMGPTGEQPYSVAIRAGRIAALSPYHDPPAAAQTVSLDEHTVLLPGLIDAHVHINDPGRDHWEGFESATRAAAAGGVTTILDMPLNSLPPTLDLASLQAKRQAAAARLQVDVGLWGGAVPDNLAELPALHHAGVFGVKCFLAPSGVAEFPSLPPAALTTALRAVAAVDGLLLVHAEHPAELPDAAGDGSYREFLASRPDAAELQAIEAVIEAAHATGGRVHIVHLSSAAAVPLLAAAQARGVRVTVETCPHYLTFAAEEIPDGATEYKCCPPIRDIANRERLWQALADGVIDYLASDHSPCPPQRKAGDFATAWGGIASLQLLLPATWTEARRRGHSLRQVVDWLAHRPARLLGLVDRGEIAPGREANLCAFAPDQEFVVDPTNLSHRHPISPYAGRRLSGVVRQTWLRGISVPTDRPTGKLLAAPPRSE